MAIADKIMKHPLHPYTLELYSSVPGIKGSTVSSSGVSAGEKKEEADKGIDQLTGCPYIESCPLGDSACTREKPELREIEEGHMVACYKIL